MASVSELTVRVQESPLSWAQWEGWSSPQEAEKMLMRETQKGRVHGGLEAESRLSRDSTQLIFLPLSLVQIHLAKLL